MSLDDKIHYYEIINHLQDASKRGRNLVLSDSECTLLVKKIDQLEGKIVAMEERCHTGECQTETDEQKRDRETDDAYNLANDK